MKKVLLMLFTTLLIACSSDETNVSKEYLLHNFKFI